jgi:hypothetical protein
MALNWPPKGLARPAQRALAGAGIKDLNSLASRSRSEVAGLHGMGPGGLRILEGALAARGLCLRP